MALINRDSAARDARKADRDRMVREEEERAQLRRKNEELARRRANLMRTGYGLKAGTGIPDSVGGYGVTIHDDGTVSIGDPDIGDFVEARLPGLRATLETLEQARDRVTATRLLALGVFALAVPKRDQRRVLAISNAEGFEAAIVVDASNEVHLRQWVAWFNRQGAQAAAREQP
jgi:hypothetical protein